MQLTAAFFRLVRWSNLVFIVLTQALFYLCVYLPLYNQPQTLRLLLLVMASVFIAAGGYIINDYFDVNIDRVNKPRGNVVDSVIHRRWAIIWHFWLSAAGVLLTGLAVGFRHWYVVLGNLVCVFLLWFYSTSFKRRLLIGNVVISLLTAWTILILFFAFSDPANAFDSGDGLSVRFFRRAVLYASFAFLITLIREAVKDMEDLEGDERYGCKTLPVVAGIKTTKIYTAIWTAVLIATLMILQLYVLQFGWWPSVVYATTLVIVPLIIILRNLQRASAKADFADLSRRLKWVMLAGILSMVFFKIYV